MVCRVSSNCSKLASLARRAILTEINGIVKYGEIAKGHRKVYIISDDGEQREYSIPRGVHINVQEGERVRAGDPLMDGPRNPHDILHVLGENELQKYLVNEIQEVYRLQGVNINDKHLEVICRQMMRWVKVEDIGDTEFLPEEIVDKFKFREENDRVVEAGGRPATGKPILLGITKASLSTDSFISAASFQETTRVLTEAAINGKVDYLRGLKENVIMGRLIPAGTGMDYYRGIKIAGEDVEEEDDGRKILDRRRNPRLRRRRPSSVRGRPFRRYTGRTQRVDPSEQFYIKPEPEAPAFSFICHRTFANFVTTEATGTASANLCQSTLKFP